MTDDQLLSELVNEHDFKDDTEKQIYADIQHIANRQDDKDFEIKQMRIMVLIMFLISVSQSVFFLRLIL